MSQAFMLHRSWEWPLR